MGKARRGSKLIPEGSRALEKQNAEPKKEIEERVRTEKVLKEREERYRTILETIQEGYFETDLRGRLTFFNEAVCRSLGYSREELLGMAYRKYTTAQGSERMYNGFHEIYVTGRPSRITDYEIVTADGSCKVLELSPSLMRDGKGRPIGFRGVARDVTERKKAEQALEASEKKYMNLVENSPDIIYCLDAEGCFTFVGGALRSLLGYSPEELLGRPFQCIMRPEDVNRIEGRFNERRTGKRATRRFEICLVPKTRDREKREPVFEIHAFGVYDEMQAGQEKRFLGTYGVARDITDSRRAEEQLGKTCRELQETRDMLLQSEKLAAIGRLMAGVAHEVLNPVNIISTRLQMVKSIDRLDPKVAETLDICESQIKRITTILDNLSRFSRKPGEEATLNDLNEVVQHVVTIFAPQFKEDDVQIQSTYGQGLPPLRLVRSRIEQVFFNILSNALEATSGRERREITVTTSRSHLGDYAQVMISDTGVGIDIENMNRIFDPFFTTKKRSEGTGLGLFLSYGIIKDHGGRIWAENNDAGGASFHIHLPVVTQKESDLRYSRPRTWGREPFVQEKIER